MTTEEILFQNVVEYKKNAMRAHEEGDYNTAVTLFFKAMIALADLHILKKEGKTPTSHKNRFRILEERYPEIYRIVDKDFSFYQDSYKSKLDKEVSTILKEDVERIAQLTQADL